MRKLCFCEFFFFIRSGCGAGYGERTGFDSGSAPHTIVKLQIGSGRNITHTLCRSFYSTSMFIAICNLLCSTACLSHFFFAFGSIGSLTQHERIESNRIECLTQVNIKNLCGFDRNNCAIFDVPHNVK